MSARHLLVAGLGRCGTTMLMTMLDAGGFPVAGPRPSYELSGKWSIRGPDLAWLADQAGRAVKWVIPTPDALQAVDHAARPVVLLMARDARQQARSQVKLAGHLASPLPRGVEKAVERALRCEMPVLRARLRGRADVQEFFFESVLADPGAMALALDDLLRSRFGFDGFNVARAARVVMKRHADCLPDLWMEASILPLIADWIEGRRSA